MGFLVSFGCLVCVVGVIYKYFHWYFFDTTTDIDLIEIPHFLLSAECDQWIQWIRSHPDHFKTSEVDRGVFNRCDRIYQKHRRSEQCWLDPKIHPLAAKVRLYAYRALYSYLKGILYHEEKLQVVKYAPGGYFRRHYDERVPWGSYGRHATLLVYLNDDYDGGETVFPRLSREVKPEKGKAILFKNTHPGTRRCLWKSLHEGQPIHSGEKYILNLWVHLKK